MYPKVDALVAAGKVTAEEAAKFKADNSPNVTAPTVDKPADGSGCTCAVCSNVFAAAA